MKTNDLFVHVHAGIPFLEIVYSSTIRRIPQLMLFSEDLWSADGQHAPGQAPPTSAPQGLLSYHVVYHWDNAEMAGVF